MKSVLKVLCKLKIISQEDINDIFAHEQFVTGSSRHKIWVNIITTLYEEI